MKKIISSLAISFCMLPAFAQNYQTERENCMTGNTQQDRQTCLKEASAAKLEASRGNLRTPNESQVLNNALARCRDLMESDEIACVARLSDRAEITGSVAEGGVLRKVEIIEVPVNTPVIIDNTPVIIVK